MSSPLQAPDPASGTVATPRGRVLHVFDHSFPINDGYAFRSREIIRFLRRSGWHTAHVTSAKQGHRDSLTENVDGLEFYRTPLSRLKGVPVLNQYGIVSTLRHRLAEVIQLEQPELLHVYSPCLNGLAALPLARQLRIPIIYEVRALWEDGAVDSGACTEGDLRYRTSRMLETRVCRQVDHIVTICEGLRQELVGRGIDAGRITVVPNSVDLERFSAIRNRDAEAGARMGLTPGKTFGFIGSFFPFEGLQVFVRAAAQILASEPQARFVLVGDGADAPLVRELARELGVEHAVVLTGRVPHAEVVRYYDLIDVLVYPRLSKRVTELVTPLKPLEAMAQNKLVIASDVGGHKEMVFPGRNGLLFRAGDPSSLAAACLEMLRRPEEWNAFREQGSRYVRDARSWNRNVEIYDELYGRMIGRAQPGRRDLA